METTQRLAKDIEAKKADIEAKKAELTTLLQPHAVAERRESELLQALRKLTASDEEQAADAAAKLDGVDCGDLPLGTVH
jgi:argininosuccinate lyase